MKDLIELLQKSSSTRRYFLSLPVDMQMKMHQFNASICTAEQLHHYVEFSNFLPGPESSGGRVWD